jgi:hypothetical protein
MACILVGLAFLPFYETKLTRGIPVQSFCRFAQHLAVETEANPDWHQFESTAKMVVTFCEEKLGFKESPASALGTVATHLWNVMKINFDKEKYSAPIAFEYLAWTLVVIAMLIPSATGHQFFPLLSFLISVLVFGHPVSSPSDLLWPFWTSLVLSGLLFISNFAPKEEKSQERRYQPEHIPHDD